MIIFPWPGLPVLIVYRSRNEVDVDAEKTPVFKTYEADSVPDTPLTDREGRILLDDIRNAVPEDFLLVAP